MAGMNMRLDNELKRIADLLNNSDTAPDMRRKLEAYQRFILASYDPRGDSRPARLTRGGEGGRAPNNHTRSNR
jgi:hypothetical protein